MNNSTKEKQLSKLVFQVRNVKEWHTMNRICLLVLECLSNDVLTNNPKGYEHRRISEIKTIHFYNELDEGFSINGVRLSPELAEEPQLRECYKWSLYVISRFIDEKNRHYSNDGLKWKIVIDYKDGTQLVSYKHGGIVNSLHHDAMTTFKSYWSFFCQLARYVTELEEDSNITEAPTFEDDIDAYTFITNKLYSVMDVQEYYNFYYELSKSMNVGNFIKINDNTIALKYEVLGKNVVLDPITQEHVHVTNFKRYGLNVDKIIFNYRRKMYVKKTRIKPEDFFI